MTPRGGLLPQRHKGFQHFSFAIFLLLEMRFNVPFTKDKVVRRGGIDLKSHLEEATVDRANSNHYTTKAS